MQKTKREPKRPDEKTTNFYLALKNYHTLRENCSSALKKGRQLNGREAQKEDEKKVERFEKSNLAHHSTSKHHKLCNLREIKLGGIPKA
jgi:hypothetical protein